MVAPPKSDGLAVDALPLEEERKKTSPLKAISDTSTSPLENERPTDWPAPGPIDLGVHDLPHASSATEWWYLNTHLETEDGRDISVFASFFRVIKSRDEKTKELQ